MSTKTGLTKKKEERLTHQQETRLKRGLRRRYITEEPAVNRRNFGAVSTHLGWLQQRNCQPHCQHGLSL